MEGLKVVIKQGYEILKTKSSRLLDSGPLRMYDCLGEIYDGTLADLHNSSSH